MESESAHFEKCLVMVLLSNSVQNVLEEPSISPEQLLRFVQNQQRYISAPFRQLSDVRLESNLHLIQAVWPLNGNPSLRVSQAISVFLAALKSGDAFNRWALAEGLPQCKFHAGLDLGELLIASQTVIGEVINSAMRFAEEAITEGIPLIIASECYDFLKGRLKRELRSAMIEVKSVAVRRTRKVVPISISDAEVLTQS